MLRQSLSVLRRPTSRPSPPTAFRWQHRFLQRPQKLKSLALQGVVEADETYSLRWREGRRGTGRESAPSRR